jgi:ABC-2 type transport system ATP-binding protein
MNVLSLRGLGKSYGGEPTVAGIDLEVARGEVVGLLGLNGAGKTTLINKIIGVLTPDQGTILINEAPLTSGAGALKRRVNFAAVSAALPGNMTIEQNLRIFGMLYGVRPLLPRIDAVVERFSLESFRHTRCGLLSSGEQTRVNLAKALLTQPDILLLDEPTASLDPATAREMRRLIRDFADSEQGGVLWTSHNMQEVETVCDRIVFLSRGRIALSGTPAALLAESGAASLDDLFVAFAQKEPHD